MALHTVKCPFCGLSDRVNGEVNANQFMREHIQTHHPVEFNQWKAIRENVLELHKQIRELSEKSLKEYGIKIY